MKDFLRRKSLPVGLLLMFLLTWPIDLANSGVLHFKVPFGIYVTLGYGFIYASLILTGLTEGRAAVVRLLKRFLIWRVGWKWYVVALLLLPGVYAAAVAMNAAATQGPVDFSSAVAHKIFGASISLPAFALPFLLFDALTNGEEMGWRGFVLPRLQSRYGALVASLFVGVFWALWHIPKFLVPDEQGPFLVFTLETVLKAILFSWVYNNTRGSLLLVTLLHASGNTAGVFLPMRALSAGGLGSAMITPMLLLITVLAVVSWGGARRLSRTEPVQQQA